MRSTAAGERTDRDGEEERSVDLSGFLIPGVWLPAHHDCYLLQHAE